MKKSDILDKNHIDSAISKFFFLFEFFYYVFYLAIIFGNDFFFFFLLDFFSNYLIAEKRVLQISRHPFVVRLRYSFQSETTLYLVMDFCSGGELFTQLRKRGKFTEQMSRFYAAEVLLALEYLHDKLGIIYRDLKPENILLDTKGHVKLTDFGLSKENKRTNSFCGTPEYLAPEILLGQGHDSAVDWWSFGCLIYELLAGLPPFSSRNKTQLYYDILKVNILNIRSY